MAHKQNNGFKRTRKHGTARIFAYVAMVPVVFGLFFAGPACGDLTEATQELDRIEEVVFAVRQLKGPHWYENIGYA
ncbi:MAG: hypothetical protein HQ515_04230, partial [Phycisphaeraceae bacterium]|nr:hypothetical protein [Phycisphaeraceae bacterium]